MIKIEIIVFSEHDRVNIEYNQHSKLTDKNEYIVSSAIRQFCDVIQENNGDVSKIRVVHDENT